MKPAQWLCPDGRTESVDAADGFKCEPIGAQLFAYLNLKTQLQNQLEKVFISY